MAGDMAQGTAHSNGKTSARPRASPRREPGATAATTDEITALARAGKHADAIDRATTALEATGRRAGAEDRMALLELRLESRIALGQIDGAAADALAMAALGQSAKSIALKARALIGKVRVRIRRDNKEA